MKTNLTIGLCIAIVLLTVAPASAWLDTYTHRQSINLTGASDGAQTDYQINLSIPYASSMQGDFDDVRFTQADGVTLIDAWLESKVDDSSAEVWAEFPTTPANGAHQTYYMYYGNVGAASDWDGGATFIQYHGVATSSFLDPLVVTPTNIAYEGKIKRMGTSNILWGLSKDSGWATEALVIQAYAQTNVRFIHARNDGVSSSDSESPTLPDGTWVKAKITCDGSDVHCYVDDDEIGSGVSSNIPNENLGLGMLEASGYSEQEWSFARKFAANPATYVFGSEEVPTPADAPHITAYNNVTGTRAHVPLGYGTTVMFNATAGDSITWSWTLDGVDQSTSADNYIHTFVAGFGYYAVTVTATNAAGTDTYTWGIWENIETTAETIPTFTDTSYQMLLDSIDYPPDMEEFGKAMAHPFVQMVGVIFYLFIFGIPLLMMYIRQDNMTMPTTLLLLFGSIIIFMLPPQWQIIAGALMTLGFVGILFKLYKERER